MKKYLPILAIAMLLSGFSLPAQASIDYDYNGNFVYHNDVLQFGFSLAEESNVTLFSSSWQSGGFDPMLGLWGADGNLIQFQDDGNLTGTTASNGVSYAHGGYDSYFSQLLAAGSYIVTISTYNNWNTSTLLSSGFNWAGLAGIAIADWSQPANGYRTPDFAFHILGVTSVIAPDPTVTPEPGTIALLGIGLAGLYTLRRRSR